MSDGTWALVPQKYVITGPHSIQGKNTGEIVELELTPDQVTALVAAGHVKPYNEAPELVAESLTAAEPVIITASDGINTVDAHSPDLTGNQEVI